MNASLPMPGARAVVAAFAIACYAIAPLAVSAQSKSPAETSVAIVSCADAAKTMSTGMMPSSAMMAHDATDTDATYRAMTTEHTKALMSMAKLEMRCGQNAKVKADAKQDAELLQRVLNSLQIY